MWDSDLGFWTWEGVCHLENEWEGLPGRRNCMHKGAKKGRSWGTSDMVDCCWMEGPSGMCEGGERPRRNGLRWAFQRSLSSEVCRTILSGSTWNIFRDVKSSNPFLFVYIYWKGFLRWFDLHLIFTHSNPTNNLRHLRFERQMVQIGFQGWCSYVKRQKPRLLIVPSCIFQGYARVASSKEATSFSYHCSYSSGITWISRYFYPGQPQNTL